MRSITRDLLVPTFAAAILVTGCAAPPAASEPQGRVLAVDQVAGFWSLRGNDGTRCDLSLANLVVDGVRQVLAERCAIPAVMTARSWRATAAGFEMLSEDGAVVMAFRRTGEDDFLAVGGRFRLSRAPIS